VSANTDAKHRELIDWVVSSSRPYKAPVGRDFIDNGPWCVWSVCDFNAPPTPVLQPPTTALCLYLPNTLGVAIPKNHQVGAPAPGVARDTVDQRLHHLVWVQMERRFPVALFGLADPQEPISSALNRQCAGLDLETHAVVGLPLWQLTNELELGWLPGKLPLVR
jgi:hypothetical protein